MYIYIYVYIYIYIYIIIWCVCCAVDFGQVNAAWVLVFLMTRFLLTNDISD